MAKRARILRVLPETRDARAAEAAAALREGALVAFPTDTVYGIAVHPSNPAAIIRLYAAKKRPADKPIPLLADGIETAQRFGAVFTPGEKRLAERFWPGPLTLVLRAGTRQEGFRVPDHDVTLSVLRAAGNVLRVTSANLSGKPAARTAQEALDAVGDACDIILDAGPAPGGKASTVVRVEGGRAVILRAGAIVERDIRNCLRELGYCRHGS